MKENIPSVRGLVISRGYYFRAYREFEERAGIITTNRGSKTELIRSTVNRKIIPFSPDFRTFPNKLSENPYPA